MNKKIVFIGTGAVAAELTSYLEDGSWGNDCTFEIKGYLTYGVSGIDSWKEYQLAHSYLGLLEDYQVQEEDHFILALGNSEVKRKIVEIIKARNGKFMTLIHPTAIVAKTAKIGEGNILCPFVMIGPNVLLGNFNLLTSQSIISHDSKVGDFNFFATALLCGHTIVGDANYMGIRVTTVPDIIIGNRNKIQAGMIVDKNVGDDSTLFYRYKEKLMFVPSSF